MADKEVVAENNEETKQEEVKKEEPAQLTVPAGQSWDDSNDGADLVEVKANQVLIDRAVATIEDRFTARVLRTLTTLRKRLDASNLAQIIDNTYGSSSKRMSLRSTA